ncbi:unnamed protein product [Acanthoscelides obtectus]|uniref:Uncharacterized protein n=1 Tax=Acanthoscelides obtectus TaxID=200917 RepID=A0A9P0KE85_ACAOB|nr:unnamed protein product [Acanthoscelides obtectus]CAK1647140.1 hypothetical protein AOBTE_LOCUS15071 [Acanthoscelides obtectus]
MTHFNGGVAYLTDIFDSLNELNLKLRAETTL